MLCCTASFVIAAFFYGRPFLLISSHPEAAQAHPLGAVPGLCALPADFLRNQRFFVFFTGSLRLLYFNFSK
jgi:hypothetical protein